MDIFMGVIIFLIKGLLGAATFLFVARFVVHWTRVDLRNPYGRVLLKCTDPWVQPVRQVAPLYREVDGASLLWVLLLQGVQTAVVCLLTHHHWPAWTGLMLITLGQVSYLFCQIVLWSIVIRVGLRWMGGSTYGVFQLEDLLDEIINPYVECWRRRLPTALWAHGLDLSPLLACLSMVLLAHVLLLPLIQLGDRLI